MYPWNSSRWSTSQAPDGFIVNLLHTACVFKREWMNQPSTMLTYIYTYITYRCWVSLQCRHGNNTENVQRVLFLFFCWMRFWTESAELPGPLEVGIREVRVNRFQPLLAAGSSAGITSFMQSFAAGLWVTAIFSQKSTFFGVLWRLEDSGLTNALVVQRWVRRHVISLQLTV